METKEALLSRRTVHFYKSDPLPEGALERALQAALRAPNHKLTNPWRFTLLGEQAREKVTALGVRLKTQGQELPEKHVNRIRKKLATPPVLLVVSQLLDEDDFRRKEDYAAVACAIQNISLSLWSEGIGSKWSSGGVTRHEETYQIADVDPEKEEIVGFVWAGYADIVPDPPRLPLEQVLRETP